ncbi:MAG: hypothetical protein N4A35_09435 [Flavobacteriales bacterium]|nr:hypothetical protein [Flavobacteriales bacterium]
MMFFLWLTALIFLFLVIFSLGYLKFKRLVQQETTMLLNHNITIDHIISEHDLKQLPVPIKNWLRTSGTVGSKHINKGKITQKIKMRMRPEQKEWVLGKAIQYTMINSPSFIWNVTVKLNKILGFQGRDKFENGKGEMLIKINSLVNVVNEQGEKINEGALQRYLGEMVWFPSLALSPFISWQTIDHYTAKATMSYKGVTGSGTFYFNQDYQVTQFKALRFKDNTNDAQRIEWLIDVQNYHTFDAGIEVPSTISSTWKLNEQNWTWLHLEVTDLKYN